MKKLLLTLTFLLASFSQAHAGAFIYPFDQIAASSCRFSSWSSLAPACKIDLPRITGADYAKYKTDTKYRRIYSVLYGSTYDYGWDVGYGSHGGVDIATSLGTPVRAIGDGEVVVAGWLAGWGNTVSIKHKLSDGKYIWSNYSHLSVVSVKKGSIKAGEKIGEVGNTGNSYGNHLHFQIDVTDQSHPYYYTTCGKGKDPLTIVNQWLCRDYLTNNTIDPIAFLESNGTFTTIEKIQEKTKTAPKIEQKSIKSREQILEEEIEEFFKNHTLSVKIGASANNMEKGKTYVGRILVQEWRQPFTGTLPAEGLELSYDNGGLSVFPEKIIGIEWGVREFTITAKKTGKYAVSFRIGKKIFLVTTINVYVPSEMRTPTSGVIMSNPSVILADEKIVAAVFRSKYWSNQLDIPYYDRYILRSATGKAKFCNVSERKIRKCSPSELVEELEFTYDDTYRGVLLANMIPLDYMPVSLQIVRKSDKKVIMRSAQDVSIRNPNGIDKSYTYFSEVIAALKKWLMRLSGGYVSQDRELIGRQAKEMINNYGAYRFLRAGDDTMKKKQIMASLQDFATRTASVGDFSTVTRAEFARLLLLSINAPIVQNTDKKWVDEVGTYKDVMTTLRVRYNFAWHDSFADRYFQPDKAITVGEALYMIEVVGK